MDGIKYGKIADFVHLLINESYGGKEGIQFVDATCGNGFDTLFLCKVAGINGHVSAFDIQDMAVERTAALLNSNLEFKNYDIIKDSHENIGQYISGKIDAAIFNLGYLPFSDTTVTTNPETTYNAIKNILPILNNDGRIYVTTYITQYSGHEIKEISPLLSTLNKRDYNVIHINIINKENVPPELFIIEKMHD